MSKSEGECVWGSERESERERDSERVKVIVRVTVRKIESVSE